MKKSKLLTFSLLINLIVLICLFLVVNRFGGLRTVYYKIKNRGLSEQYQHRKNLFMNLQLEKGDIVFLGNSITEQGEWAELLNMPIAKNRGISGDGVEGILDRMDRIIASQPSRVYLMIGVNDLFYHDVEWVVPHYRNILQRFKTELPATPIRVQSVLPVNGNVKSTGVNNNSIRRLNEAIQLLATEFNYKYLDLHDSFSDDQGRLKAEFTEDGLHLNGLAYVRWAEIIKTDLADSQ